MPDPRSWSPASDRSRQGDGFGCGTAMLVLGVGMVACVNGFVSQVRSWQGERQLSQRGVLTSAVLTQRRQETGSESIDFYVSYRFLLSEPKANTQFHKEVEVNSYVYAALAAPVRFVEVRYLPDDPRLSRLELAGSSALFFASRAFFCLLGGVVFLLLLLEVALRAADPNP